MTDTYEGLTRAQWRYRILDFNSHIYTREDLRGYNAKQLHDIQNGKLRIMTRKSNSRKKGNSRKHTNKVTITQKVTNVNNNFFF